MAWLTVRRAARRPAPELPSGELVLPAPPEIPAPAPRQWTQLLTMLPMVVILAAVLLMSAGSASGTGRLVISGLVGAAIVVLLLVTLLRGAGASGPTMAQARRVYLRQLAQHRGRMRRDIGRQRAANAWLYPEPDQLWAVAAGPRLWERRGDDEDFASVRVGTGPQPPATVPVPPSTKPLEQLEPLSALALRRFVRAYSAVPDLPVSLTLTGFARVHVLGDRDRTLALVRALLGQLATLHAPDDLRVAICVAPDRLPAWEWVKWLPHARHPEQCDAAGPVRLVAERLVVLEALLADMLATRPRFDPDTCHPVSGPLLVVVCDGGEEYGAEQLDTGGGREGVVVVDLNPAPPQTPDGSAVVAMEVDARGELSTITPAGRTVLGTADGLTGAGAEALARQLAPLRLSGSEPGDPVFAADLGLADLLALGDPWTVDPRLTWVPRSARDRLRARIGVAADGVPVELDLKESSEDGMGPHGLLIGATGSGKSELLRTLVLALAVTHSPGTLNFALIDFKAGAAFTLLETLPHVSAVITNLRNALPLVDRMADALNGELTRRQELLRAAGNFSSFRDYERARAAGVPLPEVPSLLVVCDEFSELLGQKPEFIDVFVKIGRLGRSLGVHLLLASQQLDEGRMRGLDGHLSYRIVLRMNLPADSRSVIGVPDASTLPRAPGHGFFQYGNEPLVRFRSAYVSGVHRQPRATLGAPGPDEPVELLDWTTAYLPPVTEAPAAEQPDTGDSLLDLLVSRLAGHGTPAHQVWLPPLDVPPTLDALLAGRADLAGALHAVAGVVDRPYDQRRDPLELDLSAGAGHVLVTGGPRSGKSTALGTLISTLALTNRPRDVQFYCLDFGGGGLGALHELPHVGGVAHRQNTGAVRRIVAQVVSLLAERERRFAEHEVDGIAAYRAARARGEFAGEEYGDVFLVVDGWQTLRKEYEELEEKVGDLAARGLAYGVHVIVACARSFDLRPPVRDLFGSRLELRLGDPVDTMVDRMAAQRVPADAPGRGAPASKYQMHLALPRIDGVRCADDLRDATLELVRKVVGDWPQERAPRVRLLPATVPVTALPARDEGLAVSVGIGEQDLAPVRLDFASDPHLLLLGDARSGKTAFLRMLARRITDTRTPAEARIVLIDHRRGLLGEIPPTHLLGHGTDSTATRRLITEAAQGMRERAPGPDVTPEQLRRRSWWRGPELFVLIDDYDLVVTALDNPLQPLLEFLPQARELGLHVVVARRSGGAGRALFEPFLARLRDVGSPGLMLSGDRAEGPLLGGLRPEVLPPGRGWLLTRGDSPRMLQLAWLPEPDDDGR